MKKFKIHTTNGIKEFTGVEIKDTPEIRRYNTDDRKTYEFMKRHIVLIEEGKQ